MTGWLLQLPSKQQTLREIESSRMLSISSYKLYFPHTNFIIVKQTILSSYKLYYHGTNFIFPYKLYFPSRNLISKSKSLHQLFICHTNAISIGKLYIDLQTLNLSVAALLVILYAERDMSDLGLLWVQGPNFPLSMVSPLFAVFSMAMFCKNCGGFCSQGWKFCSTCGSQISEEFNLRSTNPNGNGGQTWHTDKSDKTLCFADFVKLRRDDRGSQTKKGKKKPTKDEKVKVCIVSLHLIRYILFSSRS